jgi:enoyl-CoA hydratase/carnithine racemase
MFRFNLHDSFGPGSGSSGGDSQVTHEYRTIRYEVTPDRVATITLNRPEVLNAFDRQMCEEMGDAWRRVKDDQAVRAVVLCAAGERAFCAGLDVKKPYGQPDDVWNHEDPGELLSPKWQKVWKPVVCAVHGICTAGAFYLLNEADIIICATDATFFDSHVSAGMVSALEPVGLMRKVGLAQTLRIALTGNDERVTADTALQIGLVTEVVDRSRLVDRAHEIAAGIAEKPTAATQGTVRAIWESLDRPYRAAMEQGLIYTRLGNPPGMAEVAGRERPSKPPRLR